MKEVSDESSEERCIGLCRPQQDEARPDSLGNKLRVVIDNLPPSGVTLAEICDLVGQDGLLLLTLFLTIVFMVPVSIPGVSTVFGGAILLIGISRLLGRNLWLPKCIAQRVLPADKVRAAFNKGSIWLHRLERVSRPQRLAGLVSAGLMDTLSNGALIVGAVLLMAPFGLIPFSNTLPALALLFLAIGLLQRDGLCILFGHLANLATIIYFTVLLVGGGAAVKELWQRIV
ncbi:MAG: exopolysaccharide biosynthesis protein [bacterium]